MALLDTHATFCHRSSFAAFSNEAVFTFIRRTFELVPLLAPSETERGFSGKLAVVVRHHKQQFLGMQQLAAELERTLRADSRPAAVIALHAAFVRQISGPHWRQLANLFAGRFDIDVGDLPDELPAVSNSANVSSPELSTGAQLTYFDGYSNNTASPTTVHAPLDPLAVRATDLFLRALDAFAFVMQDLFCMRLFASHPALVWDMVLAEVPVASSGTAVVPGLAFEFVQAERIDERRKRAFDPAAYLRVLKTLKRGVWTNFTALHSSHLERIEESLLAVCSTSCRTHARHRIADPGTATGAQHAKQKQLKQATAALLQVASGVASIVGEHCGLAIDLAKEGGVAYRVLALIDGLLDPHAAHGYRTFRKLSTHLDLQPKQLRAAAHAVHELLLQCTDRRLIKIVNCLLARMAPKAVAV